MLERSMKRIWLANSEERADAERQESDAMRDLFEKGELDPSDLR
jgi:hypothetical protein